MITILYIIFCFNCFIAGYVFTRTEDELVIDRFGYVIGSLLGGTLLLSYFLLIEPLLQYLEQTFQLRFWFKYLFTKKYTNLSVEKLEEVNLAVGKIHTSSSIKDRMFRLGVRLINKRNSYITIPPIFNSNEKAVV